MKKKSLKNKLFGAFAAVACMFGGAAVAQEAKDLTPSQKMEDARQKMLPEGQMMPGTVMKDGSIYAARRTYEMRGSIYVTAEDAPKPMKQAEAAQYCEQLEAHGKNDWMLPKEDHMMRVYVEHRQMDLLEQLRARESKDYQVKKPFSLKAEWYWSASQEYRTTRFVGYQSGVGGVYEPTQKRQKDGEAELNVRCVRVDRDPLIDFPARPAEKMPDGSTIIYDRQDGLTAPKYMMSGTSPLMQKFDEAKKYCEALNKHGHDDWRLPTQNDAELIRRVLKDEKLNTASMKKSLTLSVRPEYDRFWADSKWGSYRWTAVNDDLLGAYDSDRAYTVCVRKDKPADPTAR